jgi:hypothetical protein
MTVAELATWLLTFEDQDADVEICDLELGRAVAFDPKKHANYVDLRGNQFVKPEDSYYNKRTLTLGEEY